MSKLENPWRTLIQAAASSPSPHNAQPWKVRIIDDSRAELFIDRKRALPDEDTTGCFMICAMGIFCEALEGIAATHGLKLAAEYFEPSYENELNLFAKFELTEADDDCVPYPRELYSKRKTSRLPNLKKPVPDELPTKLKAIDSGTDQQLSVISDPQLIHWIMDLNLETTFIDMNNAPYRKEFHNWVRTKPREAARRRDGLDARCMNLKPIEFWMNANFYWMYRIPIVSTFIKYWYNFRIGHIQHFGIISGSFWENESAVSAGRYLLKLWLEMARNDIYLHPFGNLVTNLETRSTLEKKLGIENIWLVFRMGYTQEPPESYRLDVSEIIID
ncbi:MAG: hypothetical protein DHS20C16_14330 [Phycisphaerae bacterium]|nr:MAG: hypothetical protein DHS20C16_14330 [Phycisphaerae bacterium]